MKKSEPLWLFGGWLLFLACLVGCTTELAENPANHPLSSIPPSEQAFQNLEQLQNTAVPVRDLVELTERYKGMAVPRTITHPAEQVGTVLPFWISDDDTDASRAITARLVYQSAGLNMWVEEEADVAAEKVAAAAAVLENEIFPTSRAFFGEEWRPGVDGDERINIIHAQSLGQNVIGYFSAANSYTTAVNPYSNQRETFFINLENAPIGSDNYYEVIAHELQHMIHWNQDRNEASWLNEGLAELSVTVNGYGSSFHIPSFISAPDTQLNYFTQSSADYGAAALFATYFYDRFGAAMTKQLVQETDNDTDSVSKVLADHGFTLTFDNLFADWVIANYLASHGRGQPPYNYQTITLPDPIEPFEISAGHSALTAVNQYAADYLHLNGEVPLTLIFTGTQQTVLLDTTPYSGAYFWTTVPGDSSNMHLTRPFDLSAIQSPTATLTFWSWYDIELGWDYAYISASTNNGTTWTTLPTIATSAANPHGNNLGVGFTGTSGSTEPAEWREQTADLTPYIGQQILLRFEYVTDDALYEQGFAVDDIAIPVLGYRDDVENGSGEWTAVGFVRHTNELPQTFIIQQILYHEDGSISVEPLPLDAQQHGRWIIPLRAETSEAVIVIAANTPLTTIPATYTYRVEGQ